MWHIGLPIFIFHINIKYSLLKTFPYVRMLQSNRESHVCTLYSYSHLKIKNGALLGISFHQCLEFIRNYLPSFIRLHKTRWEIKTFWRVAILNIPAIRYFFKCIPSITWQISPCNIVNVCKLTLFKPTLHFKCILNLLFKKLLDFYKIQLQTI